MKLLCISIIVLQECVGRVCIYEILFFFYRQLPVGWFPFLVVGDLTVMRKNVQAIFLFSPTENKCPRGCAMQLLSYLILLQGNFINMKLSTLMILLRLFIQVEQLATLKASCLHIEICCTRFQLGLLLFTSIGVASNIFSLFFIN